MKIGIIGAMEQEVKTLRETLKDTCSWERAGNVFISGSLGRHEVIVVRSGIGKVAASITTTLLIHQYKVNMVINTGSAGGVATSLKVGDLIIADKLAYFDVDVTGFDYMIGQLPSLPLYFETSEYLKLEMEKVAKQTNLTVHKGIIVTGDSFIDSPEKLKTIKQHFADALACEMEGAAVAQTALQFNIPFLVVRAISDTADNQATQSFDEFIEEAGKKSAELVIKLIQKLV